MSVFHPGEVAVQRRRQARADAESLGRGIASEIPAAVAPFLRHQRLAVVASADEEGRPWASLLTGPPGFIQVAEEGLLRLAVAPRPDDPLTRNLQSRPDLGLLVIDLATRRRLRFNGRGHSSSDGIFLLVDQFYGNCPKYIQRRRLLGEAAEGRGAPRRSAALDPAAARLIERADTFFLATLYPGSGADASHRGGRPGFVRVRDGNTLEFPDYPGNNMFNSLGNLLGHPHAGLLFVDFDNGDLLQVTGRAQILWEPETAVRVTLDEVREVRGGSRLRFELVEPWPAHPPLPVTP